MKKLLKRTICFIISCLMSGITANAEIPLTERLRGFSEMDPRAFFVGNVTRSYNLYSPHSYKGINFADYIDDNAQTIKSVTGELDWDYKNGFAKMDTPNSQAATGFLKEKGKIRLSDVTIECQNQFATILVISLDGKPIKESEKILIQSGQDDKLFGYKERVILDNAGNKTERKEISSVGQYPYNVLKTAAVVTFKNFAAAEKVVVLDENGYPREIWEEWINEPNHNTVVKLPEDSMYTVVLRGESAKATVVSRQKEHTYQEGVDYIWFEGEKPFFSKNFDTSAFDPQVEFPETQHLLSEGAWLTNDGQWSNEDTDDPPVARYKINVQEEENYSFFARKFWYHGHFRWRFDDGKWSTVDSQVTLLDNTFLKQFIGAYWVQLGEVYLTEGEHILEIQQMERNGLKAFGIDCFLLSQTPFSPRGLLRPGEKSGKTNPGMWNFEPEMEGFAVDNLLDLRHLNEAVAGQDGPLTQKDGKIYLGNGEEVKFWGVNVGMKNITNADQNSIKYFARLMAKYGVNFVRMHGRPWDVNFKISQSDIDKIQFAVNELKNNGIYTKLSTYFVLWNELDKSDQFAHTGEIGTDGYVGFLNHIKEGYAYIIWNKDLQKAQSDALTSLLTAENPYGVPLVNEPAVGVIEIQNEDSFFFHTFGAWRWPEADRVKFDQLFGEWLIKKYGSVSGILAGWGDVEPTMPVDYNDDYVRKAFSIQTTNDFMFNNNKDRLMNRRRDTIAFMLELQKDYYQKEIDYLKKLGYKGLTIASNWNTMNNRRLDAIERYTYLPADITDKHGYADNATHITEKKAEINTGDKLIETPAILDPARVPVQSVNTHGQATSISEINWINPSSFKVDEPYFLAAYAALQGIDVLNLFHVSNLNWETAYTKWAEAVPSRMGQWPGFALAFRRGDIKEGQIVAIENMSKESIYSLPAINSKIYNGVNLDDYRK